MPDRPPPFDWSTLPVDDLAWVKVAIFHRLAWCPRCDGEGRRWSWLPQLPGLRCRRCKGHGIVLARPHDEPTIAAASLPEEPT